MALNVSRYLIVLLLLCGMVLDGEHTAEAISIRKRCACLKPTDAVPWRRIADFSVINKGPLCHRIQIVLTLKSKKDVCLNPDSKQGRRLQTCWNRILENPAKKKGCLRSKRRRSWKRQGPA